MVGESDKGKGLVHMTFFTYTVVAVQLIMFRSLLRLFLFFVITVKLPVSGPEKVSAEERCPLTRG